jgi:hypothetical protein
MDRPGQRAAVRALGAVGQTSVFFTAPVAQRPDLKKTTPTTFFTPAASMRRLIIGYARVSTTEQNLGLWHDDLKPAFDAPVDPTEARCDSGTHSGLLGGACPLSF